MAKESSKHGERFAVQVARLAKVHKSMTVFARHELRPSQKRSFALEIKGKPFD
jgi:hypothetical protein